MGQVGFPRSPKILKGAFVQIVEDIIGFVPRIVPFQFNPATMTRRMKVWDPMKVEEHNRGQLAPTAQPFDPEETISLQIEFDAADQLQDSDPIASVFGVADRIAAMEKLLLPTEGVIGDLLNDIASLVPGIEKPAARKTVPVTLFVWGPGRILPVRITEYSIEEQLFHPSLYPLQARVNLQMQVLTPDSFKCQKGIGVELAVFAYKFFRLQQDVLALANLARVGEAAVSFSLDLSFSF
jgi:hypothetical protein